MIGIDSNGVEWFAGEYGEEPQCARCGSSVARTGEHGEAFAESTGRLRCLSSAEWCAGNPMAGREGQKGAGR